MEEVTRIRMLMPRSELQELLEEIKEEVKVEGEMEKIEIKTDPMDDAKFVDPVSLIISLSISLIGRLLIERWINRKKGVLLDLGEKPPKISHVDNVKVGFLVVVDKDGKHKAYKLDREMSKKELLAKFAPVLKDILPIISG